MKLRLLSLCIILVFFFSSVSFAKSVDPESARKVAISFYYEHVNQIHQTAFKDIVIASESVEMQNGRAIYYAFNLNSGGWVLVSADDRIIPVIGYSFEGVLKTDHMGCCFNWWMEGVKKTIASALEENAGAVEGAASQWDYLLSRNEQNVQVFKEKDVAPLLLSTWNQDKYYNALCPTATGGPDGRAYVGCVATSMAVVMYYYRWPIQGQGTHGGINLGTTYYRWNEMLNALGDYNYGVAEIGYHAGKTVNMNYSATGSGAQTQDVPGAMTSHFRYNSSIIYYQKLAFSTSAWNSKIVSNIDAKHPVIYSGTDATYGGHAWVCDGYQGTSYFHMNWGWSGSANGYFYLGSLAAGGYDFSNFQGGVFEIYPPTSSYPTYCSGATTVPYIYGTIEDGSGPNNYQNNSNCSWLIHPTETISKINISFNVLNTEANNDVVTIYDGSSTSDPVLGTFSGTTLPSSVQTTGAYALIVFTTNGSTTSAGWQIEYHCTYPTYCSGITTLSTPSGSFDDGSGTNNYSFNQTCRWRIRPSNVSSITLIFTQFNVATDDYVMITDENTNTTLANYTGTSLPAQATYNTNKVLVFFKTNSMTNAAGWALNYTSTPLGVEENNSLGKIIIYPNPAKEKLSIDITPSGNPDLVLRLFSVDGREVYEKPLTLSNGQQTFDIDITGLKSGIYILNLSGAEGIMNAKVIIE